MTNYSSAQTVDRVPGSISVTEFRETFRRQLRPAVLSGGVSHWKAFREWNNLSYLKHRAGEEPIPVTRGLLLDWLLKQAADRQLGTRPNRTAGPVFETMSLARYMDIMFNEFDPTRILYARNIPVPASISGDLGDPAPVEGDVDSRTMFVGRRSYTDSHEHGGQDAFMCQLAGAKEVILHPPDHLHAMALYASPDLDNWSPVRFFSVDPKRFPMFAANKPWKAVVNPGDALYIPNPWWHAVIALDDEVGVTVTCWCRPIRLVRSHPQTHRMLEKMRTRMTEQRQ